MVSVIRTYSPLLPDLVRAGKIELHEALKQVRDFRQQTPATFEEDLARELGGYATSLPELYHEAGGRSDPASLADHPPSPAPAVVLVHFLAGEILRLRPETQSPLDVLAEFLKPPNALMTPFLDIRCRLWATIAQQERNPKGPREPKPSDGYDVDMLGYYAPYCDAMFIDNEFRGMASNAQCAVEARYGTRLFSCQGSGRTKFLAYLDGIRAGATKEHWAKAAACNA